MNMDLEASEAKSISMAVRTLLAAGYLVTGSQRHPTHVEIPCSRTSRLGAELRFLIAICANHEFTSEVREDISRAASAELRAPVFVGTLSSEGQLGWDDFLEALGGAVPSWRALAPTFGADIITAAQNELPRGSSGAAWAVFEDLVADGLEFCLGRRVRRLGARRPGKIVSDMVAQLPDGVLLVVDAKAAADGFSSSWPSLRPLVEYVNRQKALQHGHNEVYGAVIVSSAFRQREEDLFDLVRTFFSETSAALAFVTADLLAHVVAELQGQVAVRNAVRWRRVFAGGLLRLQIVREEISAALSQRVERGE